MNVVLETIKKRRSVRNYRPDQVSREHMEQILEAAIWAPSGHNTQPWHFLVIQDKETIDSMSASGIALMAGSSVEWVRKIAARPGYHLFHRAPTVVVVSGREPSDALLFPIADCAAAIQNMLLAAESLNIGTCWIGLTKFLFGVPEEVQKLGIPAGYHPLYTVAVGYKAFDFVPAAPSRKPGTIDYFVKKG